MQGTVDLMILKSLSLEPMHGWGLTQRLRQITGNVMRVNPGSLYPALERLQDHGWITASWSVTTNNRRAKYYRLTKAGERRLSVETKKWERLSAAVNAVLRTT